MAGPGLLSCGRILLCKQQLHPVTKGPGSFFFSFFFFSRSCNKEDEMSSVFFIYLFFFFRPVMICWFLAHDVSAPGRSRLITACRLRLRGAVRFYFVPLVLNSRKSVEHVALSRSNSLRNGGNNLPAHAPPPPLTRSDFAASASDGRHG